MSRLGIFSDYFKHAKYSIVIDHHITNDGFGFFNIIDPNASSTCEMLFHFFEAVGFDIDCETAEYLYIGILTDTGKFRYASTGGETHRVVGKLIDLGVKPNEIYRNIFRNKPIGISRACGAAMEKIQISDSECVAIAKITREIEILSEGSIDEIDGIIDWMMDLRGIRIACVLKEQISGKTKVSLRADKGINILPLAESYSGGGHNHAAGFIMEMPIHEAEGCLARELEAIVSDHTEMGVISDSIVYTNKK